MAFRTTQLPSGSGASRLTAEPVDVTRFCDSGSFRSFGDLTIQPGTGIASGTLTTVWSSCRFGEFTLNGTVTAQIAAFDIASETITNGTFSTSRLTVSAPTGTSEVAGTVQVLFDMISNRETTRSNIVARDARGRLSKTENLEIVDSLTFNLTSYNETISGKVFDSVHGYVEISTNPNRPFTFATLEQAFPDSGQLVLLGASGAHIRVTAVSQQIVGVELDLNGDDLYETAASLAWTELSNPLAADLGDDDRDGMHNSWEDLRGLNRNFNDAAADSDGDHATNLLEYLLGTHPVNGSSAPAMPRPGPQVTTVDRASITDLVFDRGAQKLYASLSGGLNQIVPIDPATGFLSPSIPIQEGPSRMAVSDNGQYLYVGFAATPIVRRLILASGAMQTFPLAAGTFFAEDLQVLPGNPEAFAAFIRSPATASEGVAIYDIDGTTAVQRPATTILFGAQGNVLEFSASADKLYSYNNQTSEFGFRRLSVVPNGVSLIDMTQGLITGHGVDIKFAGGLIYSSNGQVIDPDTLTVVRTFNVPAAAGNLVLPDPALGRVFFLVLDGFLFRLYTFDLNSTAPQPIEPTQIDTLFGVIGQPAGGLVRWGARGLAFKTNDGFNIGRVVMLQLR
jgi:hypothetical protein